jgi:hypothetical protein
VCPVHGQMREAVGGAELTESVHGIG